MTLSTTTTLSIGALSLTTFLTYIHLTTPRKRIRTSYSRSIPFPRSLLYSIVIDYQHGHPKMLPPQFTDLKIVEEATQPGGPFKIRFKSTLGGVTQEGFAEVVEEGKGKLIMERDVSGGERDIVTKFGFEDEGEGRCVVTIETEMNVVGGIMGRLEAWMIPNMLLGVYKEELTLLEEVAKTWPSK
ncbi:hypothetical protein HK102_012398 [Quaeritorhiza haematococci]|nr:hypothetical protein HK102_012398 [Quaeritorhiza haematococci]